MDARERKLYVLQAQHCQVLADPSRLELIHLIRTGEQTVSERVATTGPRQTNVSRHLSLLRQHKEERTVCEEVSILTQR